MFPIVRKKSDTCVITVQKCSQFLQVFLSTEFTAYSWMEQVQTLFIGILEQGYDVPWAAA
jgi:hypothetical protein